MRTAFLLLVVPACTEAARPQCTVRALEELNSAAEDRSPYLSLDGLEVVFSSARTGNVELYRATRASVRDAFGAPELLAAANTADGDYDPFLSDDGLALWYWRHDTNAMFRASRPARGAPFDAPVAEPSVKGRHPSFTGDGLVVYSASLHETPTQDIYVAARAAVTDEFPPPAILLDAAPYADQGPSITGDGTTLLFGTSALADDHAIRIARSTISVAGASAPELVEEVAPVDGSEDRDPRQRVAGGAIIFASTRPGGLGGLDLWIACDDH